MTQDISKEAVEDALGWCNSYYVHTSVAEVIHALSARVAELEAASAWQPIDTAPCNVDVLLFCPDMGCPTNRERIELGMAISGWATADVSNISRHSWATHWQPLPTPPQKAHNSDDANDAKTDTEKEAL